MVTDKEAVRQALDLDQWKYSWHIKLNDGPQWTEALDVIREKISDRLDEIEQLRKAEKIAASEIERLELEDE